ncbi:Hypothetical predicted protein [Scomber scombrus]|uniref:Uncharacterized protein n=1 Tax=Scomber scombrus TaxID=13677 RepID=A0AAV1MTM3_SCOSC
MPSPHSDRSVSLTRGHRVPDASDQCSFLTPTAAFHLDMDITHRDACYHAISLNRTAALRFVMDIGHRDTCNPCCLYVQPQHFVPTGTSGTGMPATHDVSLNLTAVLRFVMDIRHRDACDPCCFLKSNSSASLSHVHQAPGCLRPMLFP